MEKGDEDAGGMRFAPDTLAALSREVSRRGILYDVNATRRN